MVSDSPVALLNALVATNHANGILYYVLGHEEMSRRARAIAVRYNHGNSAVPGIDQALVTSCYREGDRPPLLPLVPDAISIFADPEDPSEPSRFAHRYASSTGQLYFVIDVAAHDLSLIIPLRLYVPYGQQAPGRAAIVLDSIEPVPLWVVAGDDLGVPVSGSDIQTLHHGDRQFMYAEGSVRKTAFVRIEWPGYQCWEAQIRMKNDGNQHDDSYTFRRLVNRMRGKVRKFISDYADVASQDPHWAVGHAGRITANDLTLLAIVMVSRGAVMPILKLRDAFKFGATTSSQAGTAVA